MESGSDRIDPRPMTSEEEHIKRNTDCVYFLASPLTCKKGSECEYRHSEGARVNPRDCKFWLSGNCLNPNCLFRHPPLDGLVGSPGATSGSIVTASLVTTSMQLPMVNSSAYNLSRNSVPCYYFQKGACLKGDKCPFMHGPQPAGNPVTKQTSKVSAPVTTQLETPKKDAWKIQGCSNQQSFNTALNIGSESADKPVNGAPSEAKVRAALKNANIHLMHKGNLLPHPPRNGLPRSQATNVPNSCSSNSLSWSQDLPVQSDRHHLDGREAGEISEDPSGIGFTELKRPLNHQIRSVDRHQNDKGGEEVFRESSPGFDVLVDNGVEDTDYLHDRDVFRSRSIQGGRNVNPGDGYEHHSGYEFTARLDRDRRNGAGEFQHFVKVQNHGEDRHRNSSVSEKILEKPVLTERRLAHRLKSPDGMDGSDLRHQLMKHRKLNGSLSATISGHHSEQYSMHDQNMQEKYYTHNSPDPRQPLSKSSISSRLRGRITLPKPSPEIPSDLLNVGNRGRQRGKLSPVRPSSHQGRLGERLSRRQTEDSADARNLVSHQKTRDGADPLDFAGPRSLAELKGAKAGGFSQSQLTKNILSISKDQSGMKSFEATGIQDSEVSISFEGPKPLSALLKRKRETGSENVISGVSKDRKSIQEFKVGYSPSEATPAPEPQSQDAFDAHLESNKDPEEHRAGIVGEEGLIPAQGEQITYDEQQAAGDEEEARDGVEDEDLDYTDRRDGEYDYEQVEDGHYKAEDDENMDSMDVDVDDEEDEDDFAKKIGLIFS